MTSTLGVGSSKWIPRKRLEEENWPGKAPSPPMANHVLDLIFKARPYIIGMYVGVRPNFGWVRRRSQTSPFHRCLLSAAGCRRGRRRSTAWMVRHGGSYSLKCRHRLRIWGRITSRMGLVKNVVFLTFRTHPLQGVHAREYAQFVHCRWGTRTQWGGLDGLLKILVAWHGGQFLTEGEIWMLSASSLLFDADGSVRVCMCVYTHTHTHCTWGTWMWAQGSEQDTWRARRIQKESISAYFYLYMCAKSTVYIT